MIRFFKGIFKLIKEFFKAFQKDVYIRDDGSLDKRQLMISTSLLTIFAFALIFVEIEALKSSSFKESALVKFLFDKFGGMGVPVFVFIVDTFLVPMSVDVIWPFVLDWPIWVAVLLMGLPSACGGVCGYWIGRFLQRVPVIGGWVDRKTGEKSGKLILRYGANAVFFAGLTPIPFTTVCWTAGVFGVNFSETAKACFISRFLRMALYLLIIRIAS